MPGKKAGKSKKSVKGKKGGKGKGKRSSGASRGFSTYILRIVKQIHGKDIGVSSKGMSVLNSFVQEMFARLGNEASSIVRAGKTRTLGAREAAAAVRLALPGELGRNAALEAAKTVLKYGESR